MCLPLILIHTCHPLASRLWLAVSLRELSYLSFLTPVRQTRAHRRNSKGTVRLVAFLQIQSWVGMGSIHCVKIVFPHERNNGKRGGYFYFSFGGAVDGETQGYSTFLLFHYF